MVRKLEVSIFNGVLFSIIFLFRFKYSILYMVLGFASFVFFYLILKISLWLAVVFFLIYIGALLVLFFFIFSLRKNLLGGSISKRRWKPFTFFLLFLGLKDSVVSLGGTERRRNIKEGIILGGDLLSLALMLSFICLVVWNLKAINWFNNFSLRPFY